METIWSGPSLSGKSFLKVQDTCPNIFWKCFRTANLLRIRILCSCLFVILKDSWAKVSGTLSLPNCPRTIKWKKKMDYWPDSCIQISRKPALKILGHYEPRFFVTRGKATMQRTCWLGNPTIRAVMCGPPLYTENKKLVGPKWLLSGAISMSTGWTRCGPLSDTVLVPLFPKCSTIHWGKHVNIFWLIEIDRS